MVCPWLLYLHYGDRTVLAEQSDSMRKWADDITGVTARPGLWISTSDELWSGGHAAGLRGRAHCARAAAAK